MVEVITKDKKVYTWIIVIAVVILIFGLGNSFGQDTLEDGEWEKTPGSGVDEFIDESGIGTTQATGQNVATDDFGTNVLNTLVNPRVLGLILILLVAVFAVLFIAD